MTDKDRTFRVDNVILENLSAYGKRTPFPDQPYLPIPGVEPLGPFDLWLTLGCCYLLDPKKPLDPVFTSATEVLTTLDFSRTLAKASFGYEWTTYTSDDYTRIREAFHRLRTVEFPVWGYWRLKQGRGRPRRKLVESYTGILSDYGYYYSDDVTPPDQLPDSKRRNVNRAVTLKNEPGPAIYQRLDVEPEGVYFRMAKPVVTALIEGEKGHIGSTIFRTELFQFRRPLSRNFAATKLLLRTCRQTKKRWPIELDKLVKQVGFTDDNQSTRNRQATLKSLELIQSLGVIDSFTHDQKTDQVVIFKSDRWHFPAPSRDEDLLSEGDSTG